MENQNPKENKILIVILIAAVVALVIIIGILGGLYFSARNSSSLGVATTTASSTSVVESNIAWSFPEPVKGINLLDSKLWPSAGNDSNFDPVKNTKYYRVGTVKSGQYQGGELLLVSVPFDGPGAYTPFFHFIKNGENFILLNKYSPQSIEGSAMDKTKFTVDEAYDIPELNFPKTISLANGKKLDAVDYVDSFFSTDNLRRVFVDPKLGDVYTTVVPDRYKDLFGRNGFYIKAPDGTTRAYALIPDFIVDGKVPAITWLDGSKNETYYTYSDKTGCGSSNYASVSTASPSELKVTGKTLAGDDVFEFIDSNKSSLLKDLYDNKYQVYGETQKVSFREFVADHPVFFWRDVFGRLIKFENSKYGPTAECGKPVIYLYPTKTEKVDVKVEPKGGLTYSDPAYKTGWSVVANPNGQLREVSSGKIYPYLFWEGRGGIYEQPTKGFVIAQAEVYNFLVSKLAKFGLNDKETFDFIEFWEPRMKGSPYYFVSFLGNNEMDRLAPLTISPEPDTVIRVLMDFSPLDKPIKVEGYDIKTPPRRGFTVVEWGGVLR